MNPHKKQKLIWLALGALLGVVLAVVVGCCCHEPPPSVAPSPMCADAAAPPPANVPTSLDAGSCGADATPPQPPVAFDAGPSCGTHPWAKAQACCTSPADCNA